MLGSQCTVTIVTTRLLSHILNCFPPQPFLSVSQTWPHPALSYASSSSGRFPCELWLHPSSKLGSGDSHTEAKESSGCQFLHAFPSQSSLGYPIHTTGLLFPCHSPLDTHSLFCQEWQISALFPGAAESNLFCLAKRKKKSNFSKKKKKKSHTTGVFFFPFYSSLWVCYLLIY